MMQKIKEAWENIPGIVKIPVVLYLGYTLFLRLKAKVQEQQDKAEAEKATGNYEQSKVPVVVNGQNTTYNIYANVVELWSAMYNGWDEDEAKIIQIINAVPMSARKEFNRKFNEYLVTNKKNWPWGGSWEKDLLYGAFSPKYHTTLQEACLHFLSAKEYEQVQLFFKSL